MSTGIFRWSPFYRKNNCFDWGKPMIIVNVSTDDPLRVIRKYEEKPARLLAITCPPDEKPFRLVYAMDEYNTIEIT
jgi:hypothetical protein